MKGEIQTESLAACGGLDKEWQIVWKCGSDPQTHQRHTRRRGSVDRRDDNVVHPRIHRTVFILVREAVHRHGGAADRRAQEKQMHLLAKYHVMELRVQRRQLWQQICV